mgnify:CR=1 FL=1
MRFAYFFAWIFGWTATLCRNPLQLNVDHQGKAEQAGGAGIVGDGQRQWQRKQDVADPEQNLYGQQAQ